jgi:hypothetical protein
MARHLVPFECEIDLFHTVALGTLAKRGFGAGRATTEEDAVGSIHRAIIKETG